MFVPSSRGFKRIFPAVLFAALAPFACRADSPAFPSNEDLRHFRSLNDPRLSPDGKSVLVRVIDSTADGAKSHLWLVDIARNTSRQLTYSPDSDKTGESRGEWMPDGNSILFLAHRGEHTQLFRLPLNGGEAKPFDLKVLPPADTSKLPNALPPPSNSDKPEADKKLEPLSPEALPVDIASFEISPDGKSVAFTANDPKTPGEKKQSDAKADAVWVDHEIHGARLYLLDPETSKITPLPVPLDVHHVTWDPGSSRLLAISEEPNGVGDLQPAARVWLVNLRDPSHPEKRKGRGCAPPDSKGTPLCLGAERLVPRPFCASSLRVPEFPATIQTAVWSTDGNSISFLAQARRDTPPGYRDLFEDNLATRIIHNLTDGFIGSIGFQEPIPVAGTVLVPVGQGVNTSLIRFRPAVAQPESLSFPTPSVGSFHTNQQHTGWVFLGSGSTQPSTLFYTPDLAADPRPLNTPSLTPANNRSVASKRLSWKSDGFTIEGLLYLPPQAAEHKVPLVVEVHGGPLGAYLDSYQPFVNFLAGRGWAVLRANPRGSTNYGPVFAAANKNDLGGGDYRDIMAGLDYVLKTEPVDPTRLALEGYSYGGEMAGFVEGKTSRFKAIVSGAPVIDQYSEYGTEGASFYDRWYFGKPWEHPQDAWRQSPLSGVAHATTPFMLLQGDVDSTDPLGQAQEMYRALRQMGVPVDLITYPRENHGPLARGIYGQPVPEPWHGFDARQRIVLFLQKAFGENPK